MTPLLHGKGLPVHELPAAQATHDPEPLQTRLAPQAVPGVFGAPSRQVCTPVPHEVTPWTHAVLGFVVHAWPAAHTVHCPLALHTWLVPQFVPAPLTAPSTHVTAPVAHDVMPEKQAPGLPVQDCPALQATQPPLPSHTMPAPQAVPGDRLRKSRQTCVPVEQLLTPVLQGVGLPVQFAFAVQAAQVPEPLQTRLVPQLVPAGLSPPSAQVCAPVEHDVVPTLQVLGLPAHGSPLAHATHAPPPSQTWPTPQLTPAARFAPSAQLDTPPPVQVVVPCLQGMELFVQF
jgi:hypothetical protein